MRNGDLSPVKRELRRPDDAQKAVLHRHPDAHARAKGTRVLLLKFFEGGREAPEQQVDPGLEPDRGVRECGDGRAEGDRAAEILSTSTALVRIQPAPSGIQPEGQGVDEAVLAHRLSRSHEAASAAK